MLIQSRQINFCPHTTFYNDSTETKQFQFDRNLINMLRTQHLYDML